MSVAIFLLFLELIWISYSSSKWNFSSSLKDHLDSPIVLTIKARMINILLAHSPIFYKHTMLFIRPCLDPRLTTHHSNTGVYDIRKILNKRNLYILFAGHVVLMIPPVNDPIKAFTTSDGNLRMIRVLPWNRTFIFVIDWVSQRPKTSASLCVLYSFIQLHVTLLKMKVPCTYICTMLTWSLCRL